MTTFLRTRRFRGGVRHGFNLRDVKEEGVKLAKTTQLSGDLKICRDQSLNPPVDLGIQSLTRIVPDFAPETGRDDVCNVSHTPGRHSEHMCGFRLG